MAIPRLVEPAILHRLLTDHRVLLLLLTRQLKAEASYSIAGSVVTGSSSLDLADKTKEALTGRTWTYSLYPISFAELATMESDFQLGPRRDEALLLGAYPAWYSLGNRDDRFAQLHELCSAYICRDVLELGDIRNPKRLRDILW